MTTGRSALAGAGILAALLSGCAETVVVDSLAGENPAKGAAATGRPPVEPQRLTIPPPEVSPVATVEIDPQPIHPHMDKVYRTRRLPPEAPQTRPAMPPEQRRPPRPHHGQDPS